MVQSSNTVIMDADVVVEDVGISASTAQNVLIPSKGAHSALMTLHFSDLLLLLDIPELDGGCVGPHCKVRALEINKHNLRNVLWMISFIIELIFAMIIMVLIIRKR